MPTSNIGNINTYLSLSESDSIARRIRGKALGRLEFEVPPKIAILLELNENGSVIPVEDLRADMQLKYPDSFPTGSFLDALKKLSEQRLVEVGGDLLRPEVKITETGKALVAP